MLRAVALFLLACAPAWAGTPPTATPLAELLAEHDAAWLELNPLLATTIGETRFDDRLHDGISPAWLARERALLERSLTKLDALDATRFSAGEHVSADTLRFTLETRLAQHARGIARLQSLTPISQIDGLHLQLPRLGSGNGVQPLGTRAEHERWLARAAQWPAWTAQAIANLREGMREGVVLPRVVVERMLPQLRAQLVEPPAQSVFWKPVEQLGAAERVALEPRYRALIERSIVPGYRALHDFLANEYLGAARSSVGRSALPGGAAWYATEILYNTTLARSAAEIHATGLEQVAHLRREMDAVRATLGGASPLPAFYASLRNDPGWQFAGEQEALEAYRGMKTRVRDELPRYFGRLPRTDYEVRPVEAFRAASAAGASYQRPDVAGRRPGVFYLNTFDLSRAPRFELASLSLHEAEPGHHFQIALALENTTLPGIQRYGSLPAFTEGWALYAETLGEPMGLFADPAQRLGFLSKRMFRAIRLVVDTGLHAMGWSREQAIAYMLEHSPTAEADAVAETERYIARPAQALAYLSGALEIERLRRQAELRLGERFELRDFHDELLADGMVPLPVLEAKLARWIAAHGSPQPATDPARSSRSTSPSGNGHGPG